MLDKFFLMSIVLMSNLGCNLGQYIQNTDKNASPEPTVIVEEFGFSVGDNVVARWSGNVYYEGTVVGVGPRWSTIKWSNGSQPQDIGISDIYHKPKANAEPDVKVGDFVLGKFTERTVWKPGEIEEIEGGIYIVNTIEKSKRVNLKANEIIKIPKVIAYDFNEPLADGRFMREERFKRAKLFKLRPNQPESLLLLKAKAKVSD